MRHQFSKTMTFLNGLYHKVKSVILSTVFALLTVFAVSNQADEGVTFTVSAPGATSVYLTGPWWGWGSSDAPVANDNGDGTFSFTWNPTDTVEYLWVVDGVMESFLDNTVTGTNEDGSEYTYIESLVCAPNTDGSTYAERVWLVGDGDRSDVYDDCSTPEPTALSVNLTVEVSGSPAAVKLTGPWWGWDAASGPDATDNEDGTWTVNLPEAQANLEYLWTSSDGTTDENGNLVYTTESLVDNEANGECGLDGLNIGGQPGVDRYANRQWKYGTEDVTNDIYDACSGTGGPAYPTPPAPTDAEADVISVISTSYADLEGVEFNPNWSQATVVAVGSDGVLTYSNLNYQGTEYPSQDVSDLGYLNVDFYTENSTSLEIFVIKSGLGAPEVAYDLTGDIALNQWVNVQVPLTHFEGTIDLTAVDQFKVVGNGTVYLTNLYFAGDYNENADNDNDGVVNSNDPLPNNPDFSDITQAAFSDAFGGATIGDGFVYTYPSTYEDGSATEDWAGFANKNNALYPLTFEAGTVVSFTGKVPSGGNVELEFRFEDQPHPNVSTTNTSSKATVSGSSFARYEVAVPESATEFNTFLMYLLTQDEGVVVKDVSVGVPVDTQNVSIVGEPKGIIGEQLTLTVEYGTSTDSNVTGLGLNVHYDSSVLTPVSVTNVLDTNLFIAPSVDSLQADSADDDGVSATDEYISVAWSSFTTASWPGNLPASLLTITFDVINDDSVENTVIGFSATSTAAGYELFAPPVTIEMASGSWDFDGSGSADALTDGLLLLRYAFGLRGSMLTADATDPSSTLTDAEIQALIETAHGSFADIDSSGSTDALTDGLLLLRYLFGLRGGMLVADATDPSATRAEGGAVGDYINSYMP